MCNAHRKTHAYIEKEAGKHIKPTNENICTSSLFSLSFPLYPFQVIFVACDALNAKINHSKVLILCYVSSSLCVCVCIKKCQAHMVSSTVFCLVFHANGPNLFGKSMVVFFLSCRTLFALQCFPLSIPYNCNGRNDKRSLWF